VFPLLILCSFLIQSFPVTASLKKSGHAQNHIDDEFPWNYTVLALPFSSWIYQKTGDNLKIIGQESSAWSV